jgi:hypothetical protein
MKNLCEEKSETKEFSKNIKFYWAYKENATINVNKAFYQGMESVCVYAIIPREAWDREKIWDENNGWDEFEDILKNIEHGSEIRPTMECEYEIQGTREYCNKIMESLSPYGFARNEEICDSED